MDGQAPYMLAKQPKSNRKISETFMHLAILNVCKGNLD